MRKLIAGTVLVVVFVGCNKTEPVPEVSQAVAEDSIYSTFGYFEVETPAGVVPCITYRVTSGGGVSCNWAVVEGVDVEASFVSKINSSRSDQGLPSLQVNSDLIDDARLWSKSMMNAGAISHNPDLVLVTSDWEALAENVGIGPNLDVLHTAFMNSAGHRQNIMGDFTHVGVGVVEGDENSMWVTMIFMKDTDE